MASVAALVRIAVETIRCPRCATLQEVPRGSVASHECSSCRALWWWAICRQCDAFQRVPDGVEAWRCGCGTSNRSWWRIDPTDRLEAAAAVEARRAKESRLLPRLSAPLVVALALVVVAIVGLVVLARPSAGAGGNHNDVAATCAAFRQYRSQAVAGTPASPEEVMAKATSATPDVRDAANRLLNASRTSDANGILTATSDLTRLCHPNGRE